VVRPDSCNDKPDEGESVSESAIRFRKASDAFLARIQAVPPESWSNLSPCPGWTAQDVVAHVINEGRRNLAQVRGHDPAPLHGVAVADMGSLPAVAPDAHLAAAWKEVGDGLSLAIDDQACRQTEVPTPMGPTAFGDMVDVLPEDVLIHTWDLARAANGDDRLDPEIIAHVYERLRPLDEVLRTPWAFGPRVQHPDGADLRTQFLCFVGRTP